MNSKRKRTPEEQAAYDAMQAAGQRAQEAKAAWKQAEADFYARTMPRPHETGWGIVPERCPPSVFVPIVEQLLDARIVYLQRVEEHERLRDQYTKMRGGAD